MSVDTRVPGALTDNHIDGNRAWWLAMPDRLAARRRTHHRRRCWHELSYDEQRAVLGLLEVTR